MKKIILFTAILISAVCSKAQITLEYANDTLAFGELNFFSCDISESETKYVIVNPKANNFSLYNMDMSPYIMNINVPVTDSFLQGFTLGYITRTLFDCDSNNIEYVYQSPYSGFKPFRILRTDGTVLLKVDSSRGPYGFGSFGGAADMRPIKKTSAGTKLFLDILNPTGKGIQIYSLCGDLPTDYLSFPHEVSYLKVFPNPADMVINFEIEYPNNSEEFQLLITDAYGRVIKRENVPRTYSLDVENFSSGNYFYSLATNKKVYQTGKFIISK